MPPIVRKELNCSSFVGAVIFLAAVCLSGPAVAANSDVYVSRFWHNHQPTYWPEWNSNGGENSRVQYAWDSIVLKPGQTYGGITGQHPENNLSDIFGLDDRRNAYQSGPRNSLTTFDSRGGFAISYSGSLIDNIRQLGGYNQLGYGSGWNSGYKEARGWKTPSGSTRMDMVGFTYHHAMAPLLPKSVFRKELQIFKQAWWKAWGGNADLSDHSKGYFPTEMAYSQTLIDVLADEGYQWVIVPSHHISRTCPTYMGDATYTTPENNAWKIFSSPPNKADQIGPSPAEGWWYGEPNPGNAARNVAPYAYQLHKVKYVNPETGAEKTMVAVPSDDVLSYRYGYANEGTEKIGQYIAPFATDSAHPVMVMPATDGDNAWGGGSSSWQEATPQLFNGASSSGYTPSTPQDFVNKYGANATPAHIEDGAWIFPEMDYGSPNFLKWIEPPVATVANRGITTVPGTQIDMETPGFALKFYSYAPLMAGANWCETAEQILQDEGGSVQAWKVQAPYDWNGSWTSPNDVELAWHIYLAGLDSGFNYYGGLGNDDEIKPSLATRRAVEKLTPWINANNRRSQDRTGPTVLKPQRFPYNPGSYTFGWFNNIPGGDTRFLKKMASEFYIWTHAYDLSGIPDGDVKLKVRIDNDGANPLESNINELYNPGGMFPGQNEVGEWVTIPMAKRALPKTREALNAAAANSQIDYFLPTNEVADYYFAKITDSNLSGFRGKLLDYYIEAADSKGNVSKSDIQHVFVEDDGGANPNPTPTPTPTPPPSSVVTTSPNPPIAGSPVTITYNPTGRNLASASPVYLHIAPNVWASRVIPRPQMTSSNGTWQYTYTPPVGTTILRMDFTANAEGATNLAWDNNGGADWNVTVDSNPITEVPAITVGLAAQAGSSTSVSLSWTAAARATSYIVFRNGTQAGTPQDTAFVDTGLFAETAYTYTVRAVNSIGQSDASAGVSVTTPMDPVTANAIFITAPGAGNATTGNPSLTFAGKAGSLFAGGLTWTNAATGANGSIAFPGGNATNGWKWTADIPLASGANVVTVTGSYPNQNTQTLADDAANYASWSEGTTGGSGFGSWWLSTNGTAGSLLADATFTNMNVGDSKGFALWANGTGVSKATRNFATPMGAGDSFDVNFDNNWVTAGKEVGFELRDANGTARFRFYFVGGESTYRITDATAARNSGLAYSDGGLQFSLKLTDANTYSLSTGASVITGTLASGSAISWLEFFNSGAGNDTSYNLYFGRMAHTITTAGTATVTANATVTLTGGGTTDGIPDSWWQQYSIAPANRIAAGDSDGDGFTNAQEYALGTDPTSMADAFRVTSITQAGGITTITWSAVSGKTYQLEGADSLVPPNWQAVGNPVTASSSSASQTHTGFAGKSGSFYRVKLVPQVPSP